MGQGSGKQVAIALKNPSYTVAKRRLTSKTCFTTDHAYHSSIKLTRLVSAAQQ